MEPGSLLDQVAGWAVAVMERFGAPGAGLAVALENLFPPLPSELILPLAGFAASRGDLSLWGAVGWTTAGSVAGALVLYSAGRRLGRRRLRQLVDRLPLVDLADLDRADAWFARHGARAVLFGRMVPVVRSLVSVPAGLQPMPLRQFVALTFVGSLVWNAIFVGAGFLLGESYHVVERYAGLLSRLVLVVAGVAAVRFVLRRSSRRGDRERAGSATGPVRDRGD